MNRRGGQHGSAMVELALSMLVIAPILYGTIQYGVGYFILSDLTSSVRAGARYASMRQMNGADLDGFKRAVRYRTAEGSPAGLKPEHVAVEVEFDKSVPVKVRVRVLSVPSKLAAAAIPSGQPEVSFPFLGVWTPASAGRLP